MVLAVVKGPVSLQDRALRVEAITPVRLANTSGQGGIAFLLTRKIRQPLRPAVMVRALRVNTGTVAVARVTITRHRPLRKVRSRLVYAELTVLGTALRAIVLLARPPRQARHRVQNQPQRRPRPRLRQVRSLLPVPPVVVVLIGTVAPASRVSKLPFDFILLLPSRFC